MRDVVRLRTLWYAAIRTLSPEDGGRLFQAILDYAITGETPALSGAAQAVFVMIAADIDEDNDRDKKISAIRSAAGARGAAKTNAGKSRQKAAIAGTDRQMPANAGLYQEKSANVSKCRQMPTDAPEGPRIKALDSVPAALGAGIIEKHFTLDRNMEGPDHKASLEPGELAAMVQAIRHIELALGTGVKTPSPSEQKNIAAARKSLVAARAIRQGETLTAENLAVKRPGTGVSPMRWDEVIGTKAIRDFEEDELIEL